MRTAGIEAATGPHLDLDRVVTQMTPEPSAPAASPRRSVSLGLLLSLALHLLPLLLLFEWRGAPVETLAPIPVRLVLEQPPPPPPLPAARAEAAAEPARERLSSEEVGATADEPNDAAGAQSSEAREETGPGPPARAEREPELRQAARLVPPQHEPTLLTREALALPEPEVEPLPVQPAAPVPSRRPEPRPRPPQRMAAIPGPSAIRDEYLAYLVTLVRPHLYLLPPELLDGRRGTTSLAIRVLGDGTIARIAVSQSSGYPDIDARVMQIVAAVGRFPPLPAWVEQPSWDINFHLRFPFPRAGTGRR
ncbi:MAG: TonB family protein [Alphaproteobacteria bacterium]